MNSQNTKVGIPLATSKPDVDRIMGKIKDHDSKNNPYVCVQLEYRNIVLLGRSRSGKSTIIDVINDVFHRAQMAQLAPDTRVLGYTKVLAEKNDGTHYFFTFIDPRGFFDKVLISEPDSN